ncbi:DUF922 domain-containing Zn-dependent protease [uncultured Pseudodesulfovibrio sp.]|uniref:DUF922 domain-containing Zn-dependent protease n=1 Tax=uncultured Pseudodesulfovibrio sp. TaxID=2035858 RepID=UPI0029C78B84|nr:DUF922 domain-containing Zn-dependent protease [uncultured Pseudodesulfovibrio sp.]
MFRSTIIATISTLFLLTAAPCLADVVKTETVKYYMVSGKGKKEIVRSMRRNSPIKEKGRTFQGNTSSQIKYKFTWIRKNGVCTINKVTVRIHITYLYPKLAQQTSKAIRQWWDTYMDRLTEHELVHGEIALESAHVLDHALNTLKTPNCDNVEKRVKNKFDSIMQKYKKKQRDYDKLTNHGINQERFKGIQHL